MWCQLVLVDQLPVTLALALDRRLTAPQLGDQLPLTRLGGKVGESFDGHGIGRLQGDQLLQARSLGLAVAKSRCHPAT